MKQKQHEINCARKIIAPLEFSLRKRPTLELIDLISELSRKEETYENRLVFDPSVVEGKYVMSLLSPYKSSRAIRHKLNVLILKQHLTS